MCNDGAWTTCPWCKNASDCYRTSFKYCNELILGSSRFMYCNELILGSSRSQRNLHPLLQKTFSPVTESTLKYRYDRMLLRAQPSVY
eukprot:g14425.t1